MPDSTIDADIEIPQQNPAGPPHLLVLLHGAASRPSQLAALAIGWQSRLQSARAWLPAAPLTDAAGGRHWTPPDHYPVSADEVRAAAATLAHRLRVEQDRLGIAAARTIVIGFSQGASMALELAFEAPAVSALIIAYAARLYRLPRPGDRCVARIHLQHGALDSVLPVGHAEAAARRLRAIGADVHLQIQPDDGHLIGQLQINDGTRALMNWRFGRASLS